MLGASRHTSPTSAIRGAKWGQVIDFTISHLRKSALHGVSWGAWSVRLEGESRGWLVRQGHLELVQDDLLILVRLGIARQDDMARIIQPKQKPVNRVGRHYKPLSAPWPENSQQFQWPSRAERGDFPEIVPEPLKLG